MYCSKCGKQLPDDSKFCHSCGQNIDHAGGINDSVVSIKNDPEIVRAALEGAAAVVSAQKDKVSEIEKPTVDWGTLHSEQDRKPLLVSLKKRKWSIIIGGMFLLIIVSVFTNSSNDSHQVLETEDSDGDGISNVDDECPDTPEGENVDPHGCSDSQKDSDGDGVSDADDECPDTPSGKDVYEDGCSASQTPGFSFLFSLTALIAIAVLSSRFNIIGK